jgi:hypothetical protein
MSLSSRLAIATMGYRGGFSGEGTGQNFYISEQVSVESDSLLGVDVSMLPINIGLSVESIFSISIGYTPIDVSLEVQGVE